MATNAQIEYAQALGADVSGLSVTAASRVISWLQKKRQKKAAEIFKVGDVVVYKDIKAVVYGLSADSRVKIELEEPLKEGGVKTKIAVLPSWLKKAE